MPILLLASTCAIAGVFSLGFPQAGHAAEVRVAFDRVASNQKDRLEAVAADRSRISTDTVFYSANKHRLYPLGLMLGVWL